MKNLMLSLVILISMASSCKKEQTTLNELVGDWKIDKVDLLDGPNGDSTFTDTQLLLGIGDCSTNDNNSAGCQTSFVKLDGKTIFKEVSVQYQKGGNLLSISSSNQEAGIDEMSQRKASLFAGAYTIMEQTSNTLTLKSVPINEKDLGRFFLNYLDFKHSTRIIRLKK
jgi:hypothetical protein